MELQHNATNEEYYRLTGTLTPERIEELLQVESLWIESERFYKTTVNIFDIRSEIHDLICELDKEDNPMFDYVTDRLNSIWSRMEEDV